LAAGSLLELFGQSPMTLANSTLLPLLWYNSHCPFPLSWYYSTIFTAPTVLPYIYPHNRGKYRGLYRGITAVPITVSLSSTNPNDENHLLASSFPHNAK